MSRIFISRGSLGIKKLNVDSPLADGLLACWVVDDRGLVDLVSRSRVEAYTGAPVWHGGRNTGGAVGLPATAYLKANPGPSTQPNDFTVSVVFKANTALTASGGYLVAAGYNDTTATGGWAIRSTGFLTANTVGFAWERSTGASNHALYVPTTGIWQNLTIVFNEGVGFDWYNTDGTTADKASVGNTLAIDAPNQPWGFNASFPGATQHDDIEIERVLYWDHHLQAGEIPLLYDELNDLIAYEDEIFTGWFAGKAPAAAGAGLFRLNQGNLNGLGSGGPFFTNPLG